MSDVFSIFPYILIHYACAIEVSSPAVLTQQMNYMRTAIINYFTLNVEVVTLKNDIDDCRSLIANDDYLQGKPALQTATDAAQSFYDAINPEVRDSVAIVTTDAELVAARAKFYLENASVKTPGQIDIVNPTFAEGPTSKGGEIPGWDAGGLNQNSKSGWSTYKSSIWTTGIALYYNRNSSSCEKKYVAQEVKLEHAGVYEFSAEIMARHQNKSKNTQDNGVWWFIGEPGTYQDAKIDSVGVYTPYVDNVLANPVRYKLLLVIDEPRTVRFGLDAVDNKACTNIDLSGCQVLYFGSYEKYLADIEGNSDVKGDVNGDRTVDVADISAILSVMAGQSDNNSEKLADVNGDGTVDVADISAVLSIMAGL